MLDQMILFVLWEDKVANLKFSECSCPDAARLYNQRSIKMNQPVVSKCRIPSGIPANDHINNILLCVRLVEPQKVLGMISAITGKHQTLPMQTSPHSDYRVGNRKSCRCCAKVAIFFNGYTVKLHMHGSGPSEK